MNFYPIITTVEPVACRDFYLKALDARVLFDTNVLLSLWVFADSRFAPLRACIDCGEWLALTDEHCLAEFKRANPRAAQIDPRAVHSFVWLAVEPGILLDKARFGEGRTNELAFYFAKAPDAALALLAFSPFRS